ncbi:Alpha/Beta hydrolase protein [Pelagophyceae sp. CCMP2097]|nr:Alpha/Beta hydrolase protein [Pelagophyceae sp. CCMP2097]|mmetsp:Transcript_15384/g.54779  ORF Transcript_15384/g.54779 Transcript_15384/m.54779 type:complete len:328 (+) Transcript_15384:1-984(+)
MALAARWVIRVAAAACAGRAAGRVGGAFVVGGGAFVVEAPAISTVNATVSAASAAGAGGPAGMAYDEAAAVSAFGLAEASYCEIEAWNCTTCAAGVRDVVVISDDGSSGGRAIVGYDTRDDTVFVAFRGTENIRNWLKNVEFAKTYPYNDTALGVEVGFYGWYAALLKNGLATALAQAAAKAGTTSVKATGHSAGGACATLLAYDLLVGALPGLEDLQLKQHYTFGSPRVGNAAFAADFGAKISAASVPSFRITHFHDIVPQVPPEASYYHHVAQEVWYDEFFTNRTECDGSGEDPNCSDSCYLTLLCDDVSDHMSYMNSSAGIAGC